MNKPIPPQLKSEHVIRDASKWLREYGCVIKLPDQVYHGRRHIGTLNVVENKLVFIPSITGEEWERISKQFPLPTHLEGLI